MWWKNNEPLLIYWRMYASLGLSVGSKFQFTAEQIVPYDF